MLGNYHSAVECFNNLADSYSKLYEETGNLNFRLGYAIALTSVSLQHDHIAEYEIAIDCPLKGLEIIHELLGENDQTYWQEYRALGDRYLNAKQYSKASEVYTKCLNTYSLYGNEYISEIAELYICLGTCEGNTERYDYALEHYSNAVGIYNQIYKENDISYSTLYNNIGLIYYNLGNYNQAAYYYSLAEQVIYQYGSSNTLSADEIIKTSQLFNNIGNYYNKIGDYKNALSYSTQSLEYKKMILGEIHPTCAASYLNMGNCYKNLNDYTYAKECYKKSNDIQQQIYGENSPEYAISLLNLVEFIAEDEQSAIDYYNQIAQICKDAYGELNSTYSSCMSAIGHAYKQTENYDTALMYLKKAADINYSLYGDQHPSYAIDLINLGHYYMDVENYQQAEVYFLQAIDIVKNLYGTQHYDYYDYRRRLFNCYYAQDKMDYCIETSVELSELAKSLVLKAMTFLTIEERKLYWDEFQYLFLGNLPYYSYHSQNNTKLLEATYNGVLLAKGFLLNAEQEMRNLIMESDDKELLSLYDKLTTKKLQLDRIYEQAIDERSVSTEEIESEIRELGRELQSKCQEFRDYTKDINITLNDVKENLKSTDIAIEFVQVDIDDDKVLYCALTLKNDYSAPKIIELFDQKDLNALKEKYSEYANPDGLIYNDTQLYDLVWKPLESELRNVQNIYFAPTGDLYQIAIEHARNENGMLSEHKDLYRLSSTRQIATTKRSTKISKAVVMGSFDYNATTEALVTQTNEDNERNSTENHSVEVESLNIRGAVGGNRGVKNLPGTEIEANEISQILSSAGLNNQIILGEKGTEILFKGLSGQMNNIIHIATHGFYWEGTEESTIDEEDNSFKEDPAMTRSGLLFSGVNNTLRARGQNIESDNDGILTASEISRMDLRGTDLLVLSACQTGLGEVSGEGVFGLQRGFKKAGVNTILMSLWEVDDNATQLLMSNFYKNIGEGMSKSKALKEAQETVKNYKECDYSSPYYWASFIILDGLN